MSLHNIVAKMGGDLWAGGGQANIPGPGHSAADRSVSLRIGTDGRLVVNTWGRTDWRDVLDDLRERGLIEENKRPVGVGGQARTTFTEPVRDAAERLRVAKAIWAGGAPATARTLSWRHTQLRRIARRLPGSDVIRHATGTPLKAYDAACRSLHPALLVAICDREGAFTAVEITFLDPNARRSRRLKLSRKTVGPVTPGSAVRIDAIEDEMLVGEGFFSSLSGSERFNLPAWALLSTRNMRRFRPPAGVRRLVIAADRGKDGERSADILAGSAKALGLKVWIEYPPLPSRDWNEAAEHKTDWPQRLHRTLLLSTG